MKQQDKLRKTLQEYYDTQESSYDEQEWERASLYLAEARRKRKIRFAAILLIVLLSGLLVTIIAYPESTAGSEVSAIPAKQPDQKPGASAKTAPLRETKAGTSSGLIRKVEPVTTVPVAGGFKTTKPKGLPSAYNSPQLPGSLLIAASPIASAAETTVSGTSHATAVLPLVVKDPGTGKTTDNTIEPAIMEDEETASETAPLENTSSATNIYQVPVNEITQVPVNEILSIPEAAAVSIGTATKTNLPDGSVFNSIDTGINKITPIVPDASYLSSITEPAAQEAQDSISALAGKPAREGFFYEAGAAWLYGWKTAAKREAQGISPFAGISYMDRISDHCALSFGLGYLQVNNLSGSSKTSRVSTYMYGEQSKVTVITPSSVHYILAPLRFQYYINNKNRFGLGLNLACLLTVEAKVTSYDEKPGYTGNYKTVKRTGYTDGFSRFDSQLAFVYARNIGSTVGLQAEVFIGLTDVKQDAFFNLQGKERNSGAKLSLVYYVFRKNKR